MHFSSRASVHCPFLILFQKESSNCSISAGGHMLVLKRVSICLTPGCVWGWRKRDCKQRGPVTPEKGITERTHSATLAVETSVDC